MNGIKSHFSLTLALLLFIGMQLTSFVVLFFWQQSLVHAKKEQLLSGLHLAAGSSPESDLLSSPQLGKTLERLSSELRADCVIAANNGILASFPDQCHARQPALQDLVEQAAQKGGDASSIITTTPGLALLANKQLLAAVPLTPPTDHTNGLGAALSLSQAAEQIGHGRRAAFVYIMVNVIILTTIGLFRFIRVVVRPIERLVQLTDECRQDGENPFFAEQSHNEFGQLSFSLNRMLQRIENDHTKLQATVASLELANNELRSTRQNMIQTEKMAAIGRLAAGLAHEIGNPIGIIQGYMELLQQAEISPEERKQFSVRSQQELERIHRLVQQLLNFARRQPGGQVAVHGLARELIDMLQSQKKMADITFQLHLKAEQDLVAMDRESLHQVLLNCLLNAVDAIKDSGDRQSASGTILLKTSSITGDDGPPWLEISIHDNGSGIKDSDMGSLFDPFFTTKEPGQGTGLGLSVSYALVEGAGGRMRISGRQNQGATVTIELPLHPQPQESITTDQDKKA